MGQDNEATETNDEDENMMNITGAVNMSEKTKFKNTIEKKKKD